MDSGGKEEELKEDRQNREVTTNCGCGASSVKLLIFVVDRKGYKVITIMLGYMEMPRAEMRLDCND